MELFWAIVEIVTLVLMFVLFIAAAISWSTGDIGLAIGFAIGGIISGLVWWLL